MSLLSSVSAFSLLGGGGALSEHGARQKRHRVITSQSCNSISLSLSHGLDFARYCVMLIPQSSNVSKH